MATLFAKRKAVGKQLYEEIWDLWLLLDKIQENKFDEPETGFIANLENDISQYLDKLQKAGFKIGPEREEPNHDSKTVETGESGVGVDTVSPKALSGTPLKRPKEKVGSLLKERLGRARSMAD